MDEKRTVLAGGDHFELGADNAVSDLTASGFAKKEEREIKARNAEFAAAIGENKPNAWGPGYRWLYSYCLVVYLCSTMNGYEG